MSAASERVEGTRAPDPVAWLLASDEPWTRYRTLAELVGRPEDEPEVQCARAELLRHARVAELVAGCATWGEQPLKRHNDAGHPIHKLGVLAEMGLRADDPGMALVVEAVLGHQSAEGAFQTVVNIPTAFGGSGEETWAWMACDGPVLLYSLLALGLRENPQVQQAVEHLNGLVVEGGWRCAAAPELGRFRGPGRKDDPCPMANLYALKALAQAPGGRTSQAARTGAEMLLRHWERQHEGKLYLFGIGTDFRKLKYPFIWYDLLHVVEVLSHFSFAREDPRFLEMAELVASQADAEGRYTASSMYRAWSGWSFADKKRPSPWLTFLAHRATGRGRTGGGA